MGLGNICMYVLEASFYFDQTYRKQRSHQKPTNPSTLTTYIKKISSKNKHVSTLKGRFRISDIMDEFIITNSTT